MFNFLGSKKNKLLPENSLFENIKSSQSLNEKNHKSSEDLFVSTYNEGLKIFKICVSNPKPEKSKLEYSANKFIEAIKIKSTKPEPYMCLSYIYYIMDQDNLSLKYLKIATTLDSDGKNSDFLNRIRASLSKNFNS